MTRKEFNKFARFAIEKVKFHGYLEVYLEYGPLQHLRAKWSRSISLSFAANNNFPFIVDDYFIIWHRHPLNQRVYQMIVDINTNTTIKENATYNTSDFIKIHHKFIQKCVIGSMYNWDDKSGKRESKLNYVLKNIGN